MLWLSNDSNTSCSRRRHHRPRSSSSSSSSSASLSSVGCVSYFLGGTASWRTRRGRRQTTFSSAIGVLPTSTLLVRTLLVCSIVVMIVRCEQSLAVSSLAAGRPNGSDWRSLIRHSVNQTGSRGGRWHPPARPSPALSPLGLGRARHRHQPYLPWFDSSHTSLNSPHGSNEDRPFGLLATSGETTSVLKDPLAKIVLPRQTISNPGATRDLSHNAITLNSESENDGVLKVTADTTSTSSPRLVGAKAVAGMNFTLTRWLRKYELVGNQMRDRNVSAHPSQTLQECLILNSYVISRPGSQLNLSVDRLNFQFCTHLGVAGAINPSDRRCQLGDVATEEERRQCLTALFDKDYEAQSMYERFEDVLSKYDCEDPYSTEWNCTDCKLAYKHWVCSATIPRYYSMEPADPCSHYSEMVENRCPYLSPHSLYQYAGEPVFLSTQSHTSSKEMQLRSCHFLCQDRSVNPQTENSYSSYIRIPGDCNTADLCFLPAEEGDGRMELMQANESNFISTFPFEVSVERDRQTGLPDDALQPTDHSRTFFEPEVESEESQTGVITSLMKNSSPLKSKLTSLGILSILLLVNHIVLL